MTTESACEEKVTEWGRGDGGVGLQKALRKRFKLMGPEIARMWLPSQASYLAVSPPSM